MLKIAHVHEEDMLHELPPEVVEVIMEALHTLDDAYGVERDVDAGDGGFVVVIEHESELVNLREFRLDIETALPEYIDEIRCNNGQVYVSVLVLLSDDYGIVGVMPLDFLSNTSWAKYLHD